jgi:hypothetical protein
MSENVDTALGAFRRFEAEDFESGRDDWHPVAFRFEEGRFMEAHYRWSPEEALEAAGLSGHS